mmetsp:Transcript_35698/g.34734  ORF Transcript_35698/g.34734 Transcript_35698/m.34734 type:complete len:136 (+) Transcript_35698:278-685(+)
MGIILVYDCTEEQTFNNISNWLKQIDQHASSNVAKVLVANKCDRTDKVIESEKGRQLAAEHGLSYYETSAKTGLNINEVFQHIAKVIIKEKMPTQGPMGVNGTANYGNKEQSGSNTVKVGDGKKSNSNEKKNSCC